MRKEYKRPDCSSPLSESFGLSFERHELPIKCGFDEGYQSIDTGGSVIAG